MADFTSADAQWLILHDPAAARELLDSYALLLGREPKLWWQEVPEAKSPRWAECMRRSLQQFAAACRFSARELA